MKVLFAQKGLCTRTAKLIWGLRLAAPDVEIHLALKNHPAWLPAVKGENTVTSLNLFGDKEGFRKVIDEVKPDVIHSSNYPDGITVWANELGMAPVLHDVHDLGSTQYVSYDVEAERRAITEADGVLTVSPELSAHLKDAYKVDCEFLWSTNCRAHFLPQAPVEPDKEFVYEGGFVYENADRMLPYNIATVMLHVPIPEAFWHRLYEEQIEALWKVGHRIDILSGHLKDAMSLNDWRRGRIFEDVKVRWGYDHLGAIGQMPGYVAGLATYAHRAPKHEGLHMAGPNKPFDYMAAGIPTVVQDWESLRTLVVGNGLGIACSNDFSDLNEQYANLLKIRARIPELREAWAMEDRIPALVKLYRELMA